MKPDDQGSHPTEHDPFATRPPSPQSLEALAVAKGVSAPEGSKAVGVGRDEFDRGLLDCGFVDAEGFRAILDGLASEVDPPDSETVARHLVRLGKLTRYQASALFQGKGRSLLIGPYLILDKLGSGGMGMVFKARLRDREGSPEVALKLLPPSASRHPMAVLRFRREAALLEKLDHPNVVASHELGQFNGVHYLIMDYVEGRDLDRVVRSGGPMKPSRAVDCLIQAARGLAAAHGQGIVHRDIKPANLLLDSKGTVRVLDLGLARITQGEDSVKDATSAPSLTASGIIMGTADYLPPEQSDDSKRADHRADIYALGCTLHFLLTGKPPFTGDSIMQRLLAHHQKPIPSLKAARPEVPLEVEAIYQRMMAKSPDDRPQTAAEVAEALEAWRSRSGAARGLRAFDDGGPSKGTSTATDRKPAEATETYDLLTFVRDELLAQESGASPVVTPPPLARKVPRRRGGPNTPLDLALKGLVALAAVVVLVRFFPKELFQPSPPAPALREPPAVLVDPPPGALLAIPEVKAVVPKVEVPQARAEIPPAEPSPPVVGPSRLEELLSPPPPVGPPARKKGQAPPRGPGPPL